MISKIVFTIIILSVLSSFAQSRRNNTEKKPGKEIDLGKVKIEKLNKTKFKIRRYYSNRKGVGKSKKCSKTCSKATKKLKHK